MTRLGVAPGLSAFTLGRIMPQNSMYGLAVRCFPGVSGALPALLAPEPLLSTALPFLALDAACAHLPPVPALPLLLAAVTLALPETGLASEALTVPLLSAAARALYAALPSSPCACQAAASSFIISPGRALGFAAAIAGRCSLQKSM
eukprot:CAMPEP_0202385792 /NCGR_PEP_ID=MMETSP1127-20130417/62845_1 /ASSEMBLY_ACC=CAM_ASM_000462 /TAXON_ID=3047 /ORGANISM="Dunaliella tertiolecta, Strain CCMP1320" /LENGTH=146 /DNA_ID=CAMNT_0048986101 /DNA_START=619 /DNA_END=1059 /DNA_ORIENTATION=-